MLMNRISRCISATKSITRHAFVEFIKTVLFVIETWLFNGSDGGCSGAIIRCIKRDIVLNFLSPKNIPKNVIKNLKREFFRIMQRNVVSMERSKRKWRAMKNTEQKSNRNVCISTLPLMQMRLCSTRVADRKITRNKTQNTRNMFSTNFYAFCNVFYAFIAKRCKSCPKQACEHQQSYVHPLSP